MKEPNLINFQQYVGYVFWRWNLINKFLHIFLKIEENRLQYYLKGATLWK